MSRSCCVVFKSRSKQEILIYTSDMFNSIGRYATELWSSISGLSKRRHAKDYVQIENMSSSSLREEAPSGLDLNPVGTGINVQNAAEGEPPSRVPSLSGVNLSTSYSSVRLRNLTPLNANEAFGDIIENPIPDIIKQQEIRKAFQSNRIPRKWLRLLKPKAKAPMIPAVPS